MSSECERLGPYTDILVSLYSRGVGYKWTQSHSESSLQPEIYLLGEV